MTTDQNQFSLRRLLVERSVELGEFTLASGAKSDYYIDARRTTMSAEGQRLVGRVAYAAIQDHGLDPTHVGGLTMGADPIAYAIAHVSAGEGNIIDGFSVRKSAKNHGTGQRIEGCLYRNSRVLMVEDTMTTGRSTLQAIEAVRAYEGRPHFDPEWSDYYEEFLRERRKAFRDGDEEKGPEIVGVLTLVNRSEDAEALFKDQGLPLISLYTGSELVAAAKAAAWD